MIGLEVVVVAVRPVEESLEAQVRASVDALNLGPQDAALVQLAVTQARALDEMSGELKAKMIGQVSGALLNTLKALASRSRVAAGPPVANRLQALRDARRTPA